MKLHRNQSDADQKRQFSTGIVFSGVLIALSFVAMIIPLALFHLAQVAATLRLRTALTLLCSVVLIVLLLGALSQQGAILSGGLTGLFWTPLFAIALHRRLHGGNLWISALVLCFPALLMLLFAYTTPSPQEIENYFKTMGDLLQQQQVAAGTKTATAETSVLLSVFNLESPSYAILKEFAALGSWQRLSWFVFGKGAPIFLGSLTIGLANLVFLDFGVEQVEKLRAIARYVRANERRFSHRLVEGLSSLAAITPYGTSESQTVQVTSARAFDDSQDFEERPILSYVLRPKTQSHIYQVWGFEFLLSFPKRAWRLRVLSVPIWLVLAAVVFFTTLTLTLGTPAAVLKAAQGGQGVLLAVGGVTAFVVLGLVALQGLIVTLERLAPGTMMFALVAAVLLSAWFPPNIFYLLGGFGFVGILDYAYDFRGCLAKCAKAV